MRLLPGMAQSRVPLNDWMHGILRTHAKRLIPDDDRYTLDFDKLEILIAFGFAHYSSEESLMPLGAFGYRHMNRTRVLQEIQQSLSAEGNDSPFVISGTVGQSVEDGHRNLEALKQFATRLSWS